MKLKNLLLTIAATFGMTALIMAQNVPNYVPTNGLVGWWPFNGNANDESGSNNSGIANGATLSTDRFNIPNKAYEFSGNNQYIVISNPSYYTINQSISISAWINAYSTNLETYLICKFQNLDDAYALKLMNQNPSLAIANGPGNWVGYTSNTSISLNNWHQIVSTYDFLSQLVSIYYDGILVHQTNCTQTIAASTANLVFGNFYNNNFYLNYLFHGKMDDIGIWNRALTQQEITVLYNASNCANNTAITPQTNAINTGSTATFIANTSDPNPSYVWQSDFGQGFQTLNNFGNYTGTNTPALNISNVQLANHNQPIRVISTSGNCIDTSNVAIISITDTCINTVTDTTLITVTDTLVINTTITSLNPPNNANTIKVFPNPTNDHITINYGNFLLMNGYQLKIENSLGQQVFQTNITQQSDYLNLTTWGGNGLYFVRIIDPQGNTIDIRKIVLQ